MTFLVSSFFFFARVTISRLLSREKRSLIKIENHRQKQNCRQFQKLHGKKEEALEDEGLRMLSEVE